ncbi:hypothetical protein AAU57_02160 [Nonlabens sp. YIK11]|uniref:DUF2975 domain-containing protein n=1 Tax=Nonlabens sp. YIK11 TaxID=1453349 RepID=UPI0006DC9C87|nr:DUF2975 domain-containing protein [Nonlabens sp. YIK11]KQC32259.1 hypothetical protein AAU57_02160 [Nonlabens sp. YIK11]
MKKKETYFNNSMYYFTAAFVFYFAMDIYDVSSNTTPEANTNLDWWRVIAIVKPVLLIMVLILFARFVFHANKGLLFSASSSKIWKYQSILLLIVGILSLIESRFHDGETLYFAASIFVASFCLALSKVFDDATSLKQENDLTI